MADISEAMVEAVARAIEPETFEKPRINLYGDLYERAFARARRAIEAVAALSASPASAQMEGMAIEREMYDGLDGVTPGPWHAVQMYEHRTEDRPFVVGPSDVVVGTDGVCEPSRMNDRSFTEDAANMRHIARCDPDTIRALLDGLSRLREENRMLAAEAHSYLSQLLQPDDAALLRESLPTAGGE